MSVTTEQANTISEWIKEGKIPAAQAALKALPLETVPRKMMQIVASLAKRALMPELGIKLLNPIVRPTRNAPATASDLEKVEYASCLTRIGAAEEALELLKRVASKDMPEALLCEAFARVNQWGYAEAIPLFTRCCRSSLFDEYQRMVAKVNLVSALIYERRHQEATPLIGELLEQTKEDQHMLLRINTLHFAAVNAIFQGNWKLARELLIQEEAVIAHPGSLEAFFLRKWNTILRLLEQGPSSSALKGLHFIREEAITRKHFETVRDCDRFQAFATQDDALVRHLYFGTPYEGFRRWLLQGYPKAVELPGSYDWGLQGGSENVHLDLTSGACGSNGEPLLKGSLLHRMLLVLASDFYAPFRLAALFARLYSDEFYHPVASPQKIHRALSRLRKWIGSTRLPLVIHENEGLYQLAGTAPLTVRLPKPGMILERAIGALGEIIQRWPDSPFSAREASVYLNVSYRTVHRILDEARREGRVKTVGGGPRTKYLFKKAA